ncbi:hypothetical protein [Erwinia tracheiphila]|nr:hypothetical protein [Erwinia tracheiphila]
MNTSALEYGPFPEQAVIPFYGVVPSSSGYPMIKLPFVIAVVVLFSACAVKHYPSSLPVSAVESTQLDCEGVRKAIVDQQQVQNRIDRTGEFDDLTVLGFMGDFGIGNGIAKNQAQKHAVQRMTGLKQLEQMRCKVAQQG